MDTNKQIKVYIPQGTKEEAISLKLDLLCCQQLINKKRINKEQKEIQGVDK